MNKYRWILLSIIFIELFVSILIGRKVVSKIAEYYKKKNSAYVTKINKKTIVHPTDSYLRKFFEHKPNSTEQVHFDWYPYEITYTYNADGIRSDHEYSIKKTPNVFRIMTIGDSFTFGEYVSVDETYSKALEKILNSDYCSVDKDIEVINLGVSAYDVQYTVEHFIKTGAKYDPDLVVWFINDHNMRQLRDVLTPLEERIYNETSESAKKSYEKQGNYYFAAIQAQAELEKQLSDTYIFSVQRSAMNKLTDIYKGPLVIATFSWTSDDVKHELQDFVMLRSNVHFTDAAPDLATIKDANLPDIHPSAVGHTVIANTILKYLKEQKIPPCNN